MLHLETQYKNTSYAQKILPACGPTNLSKTGFSKDRALGQPDQLHTWKNVRTITK